MRKRQAFTLVEMMVSMALVIFIMVLLSQAFVASMQSFRTLKGIGDMEEKLRAAVAVLRRDLAAQHFRPNKNISQAKFFDNGGPPDQGYLRIYHGSPIVRPSAVNPFPANWYEETDADLFPSSRCTDHCIAFTIMQTGNTRESYATADLRSDSSPVSGLNTNNAYQDANAAGTQLTYVSQTYEVAYFLRFVQAIPGGPRLYGLYRRQLLTVPPNNPTAFTGIAVSKLTQSNAYSEISCQPDMSSTTPFANVYFNTAADLTIPQRRFGMNPLTGSPYDTTPVLTGGDGGAFFPLPTGYPNLAVPGYPTFADINYVTGIANPTPPPTYIPTYAPAIAYSSLAGADILINDVVSFEIKLLLNNTNALAGQRINTSGTTISAGLDRFVDLYDSQVYLAQNALPPIGPLSPLAILQSSNPRFNFALTGSQVPNPDTGGTTTMPPYDGSKPCVYDTWSKTNDGTYDYSGWQNQTSPTSTTLPLGLPTSTGCPILALQISLRIWDRATQQTRQMTFVQPM
jgi:type II secretory pathway pseudopilin PulG